MNMILCSISWPHFISAPLVFLEYFLSISLGCCLKWIICVWFFTLLGKRVKVMMYSQRIGIWHMKYMMFSKIYVWCSILKSWSMPLISCPLTAARMASSSEWIAQTDHPTYWTILQNSHTSELRKFSLQACRKLAMSCQPLLISAGAFTNHSSLLFWASAVFFPAGVQIQLKVKCL